jgi:hypothetical protein
MTPRIAQWIVVLLACLVLFLAASRAGDAQRSSFNAEQCQTYGEGC